MLSLGCERRQSRPISSSGVVLRPVCSATTSRITLRSSPVTGTSSSQIGLMACRSATVNACRSRLDSAVSPLTLRLLFGKGLSGKVAASPEVTRWTSPRRPKASSTDLVCE
ncbi:hypothetical protein D3C85_1224600 [compost metagenome]